MKRGKKMLNAKLERHMARLHALLHEVSTFIYIYIYIDLIIFKIFKNIKGIRKKFSPNYDCQNLLPTKKL